ncbi:hypothetical protein IWX49DRAFT_216217 [Phyllosticta citricarpa]|uniref:UBA domain-containing protein Ucp14 n=2 Tax=Phyllosticta TaxID=121621 RepID=A0ABR1MME0_9PEZI
MLTSGFTNAPVSKFLVFYVVASALVASITDSQYLLWIQVVPHLWGHGQFWRVLTWQFCYANSTEVLFAAMTFYHLRVIERLWGSRKFASFLLSTLPYTTLLPPLLLALIVRPLTFNHANCLPGGLTPTLFALLAQYHAAIPQQYKYRLAAAASSTRNSTTAANNGGSGTSSADGSAAAASSSSPSLSDASLTLSNKSWHYLLAIQLALSAVPGSLLAAAVGWAVGTAWRNEALPLPPSNWRLPGWVVGEQTKTDGPGSAAAAAAAAAAGAGGSRREFESLRERMERERERGSATGREMGAGSAGEGGEARRREGTLGGLLAGQFGGAER